MYERTTGQPPFALPKRWLDAKARLDLTARANFTTTTDIVGGNSGSPMVNAAGEIVGLVFDGNIHSISGWYWFDTEKNRTVAVHPEFIRTALSPRVPRDPAHEGAGDPLTIKDYRILLRNAPRALCAGLSKKALGSLSAGISPWSMKITRFAT